MKKVAILIAVMFFSANVYAADNFNKQTKAKPAEQPKTTAVTAPVDQPKTTVTTAPAAQPETAATANPAAQPQATATTGQATNKTEQPTKLTRVEMLTRINDILKSRPNVASSIQGVELVKPEGGTPFYTYNKKKIEELDDESLLKLLSLINQQVSLENLQQFDRQQRQMKNLQQIEQINRTQRNLQQLNQINQQNRNQQTYTAPKTYKTPGKY